MKEYVITLKSYDDLDGFYDDMETPGGNLYIPDRSVELVNRRANSRNTHYMLTDEEAELIRNDPRVLHCTLTPEQLGLKVRPAWIQSSDYWNKSLSVDPNHKNWGLLRCVEGVQRENWGDDSISTITTVSGTIQVNAEGRNVDVVIIDGFMNINHPEFAVNSDGTGGTRIIQYNWLQHAISPGTYSYSGGDPDDNNHGAHVAGTVAGNTQGWARSSNIYNLNPYLGNIFTMFDYVRAWHASKTINPLTGRKNPTIVNNSWGYIVEIAISDMDTVFYRNQTYSLNVNLATHSQTLTDYGILNDGNIARLPYRYEPYEEDIFDAMQDGIIMVGAAGNESYKIDLPNGIDYNNYFDSIYGPIYYHRGMSPTAGDLHICVGAIGRSIEDSKAWFSNCGPRIDIYAPGRSIISSVNSGGVNDLRSSGTTYYINKYSGTSMASPQVCGVLACLLEIYPNLTQEEARNYIITNSKKDQIFNTNGGYNDDYSLQGSPNRYLYYYKERADTGTTWPKLNYKTRPSTGRLYPRQRIRKTST
jgi:subtilisin family serine protease